MTLPDFLVRALRVELGTTDEVREFGLDYVDLRRLRPETPEEQFEWDWVACFDAWQRMRLRQERRRRDANDRDLR